MTLEVILASLETASSIQMPLSQWLPRTGTPLLSRLGLVALGGIILNRNFKGGLFT